MIESYYDAVRYDNAEKARRTAEIQSCEIAFGLLWTLPEMYLSTYGETRMEMRKNSLIGVITIQVGEKKGRLLPALAVTVKKIWRENVIPSIGVSIRKNRFYLLL